MIASRRFKTEGKVLACAKCHECLNRLWYYPDKIYEVGKGLIRNPFRARCKNCGSRQFVVGSIPTIEMEKWEKRGWEFIPWYGPVDVPNPDVRNNHFIIQSGKVFEHVSSDHG